MRDTNNDFKDEDKKKLTPITEEGNICKLRE